MVAHADGHGNLGLPASRDLSAVAAKRRRRKAGLPAEAACRHLRRRDQGCHAVPIQSLHGRWASGGGGRRESLVREHKPLRQQPRRLSRSLTVERHHGGRHAGPAVQLRPPPVADGRHLDLVVAPADGFFEAMNDHVCDVWRGEASDDSTPRGDAVKRSATRRARPQREAREIVGAARGKNISLSGSPQDLHLSSTGFPQVEWN